MPVAPARPHTTAVAAALTAAELRVGRGKKPPDSGWEGEPGDSDFRAYVVLFPSPGTTDGDLCDPHEYLDFKIQATCVAATQDGCEEVADIVKTTLVGVRLSVPGRSLYPFQIDGERPASRDDQVDPPVHYAIVQLACRSGPA